MYKIGDIVNVDIRGMEVFGIERRNGKTYYQIMDNHGYCLNDVDEMDLIITEGESNGKV